MTCRSGSDQPGARDPYEFVAHTYSTLTFAAHVSQNSFEPGAVAEVSASLLEYAALPTGRARVWAEVQKPGGMGADVVSLALGAADRYVVSYPMPTPGLYTFRIRARGETMYGIPFEREHTLTAVAVPGGDQWSPNDPPRDVLCELLDCIRRSGAISSDTLRRLEALGFNVGEVLKCLDRQCRTSREGETKGSAEKRRVFLRGEPLGDPRRAGGVEAVRQRHRGPISNAKAAECVNSVRSAEYSPSVSLP